MTATLASFGPGGMLGGIVSIALLTGTGSAVTTLGATQLGTQGQDQRQFRARVAERLAEASPSELGTMLTSLLAVVRAQQLLGFASSAPQLEQILVELLAVVERETEVPERLAPGSSPTRDWKAREDYVRRAQAWLTSKFSDDTGPASLPDADPQLEVSLRGALEA